MDGNGNSVRDADVVVTDVGWSIGVRYFPDGGDVPDETLGKGGTIGIRVSSR